MRTIAGREDASKIVDRYCSASDIDERPYDVAHHVTEERAPFNVVKKKLVVRADGAVEYRALRSAVFRVRPPKRRKVVVANE